MESSVKETEDSNADLHRLLMLQFTEFADATISMRARAEKARRYKNGEQWSSDEVSALKKRKQPVVTDNKIKDKCDALLGIEKQMRTDPKAYARTPKHEDAAEAATDALRFVADQNRFQRSVRKPACDNLIVEGLCAGQVVIEEQKGKSPKVCMEHIRWDRLFYDIHSLEPDFSDKEYAGMFTWMDEAKAKDMFPGKDDIIGQSFTQSSESGPNATHDDKPRFIITSRTRNRLQVFEHYFYRDGKWMFAKWCKGGFLEGPSVSAYKDENGEPLCCIELEAVYRDEDGDPYGLVDRYLDLQDEINKRRSKMMHLLNTKQVIADKGAVEDINKARQEIHKPDGYIEKVNGMDFEVHENTQLAEGQWQLLVSTTSAMDGTGPNAALLGNTGSISGRAKQIDQQAGTLTVTPLFDSLTNWELRMFRQAWYRIKQFWTQETWIRVTDEEAGMQFVALNERQTYGHLAAKQLASADMPDEEKAQALQQIAQDPQMRQPAIDGQGKPVIDNNVAEMDVDIILDETPDVVTVQQEQFEILATIAEKRPDIPTSALIEMSQLRSSVKKRITDQMSGANDPMKAQVAQLQAQMAQLEATLKQVQIAKTVAETEKIQQDTAGAHIDAAIKVSHATDPVKISETIN